MQGVGTTVDSPEADIWGVREPNLVGRQTASDGDQSSTAPRPSPTCSRMTATAFHQRPVQKLVVAASRLNFEISRMLEIS